MPKEILCETCDNEQCFIKKYCYPEWWPLISMNKPTYQYRKGEQIIKEGDPMKGIFFIYSGKVKVHKHWKKNQEYIVRLARSGDILGHRGLGGDLYYPISATALEDSVVDYLDNEFFFRLLKTNHELTYNLMLFYAEELKKAERRMRNLAHMSVKGRIADSLLMIQEAYGNDGEDDYLNLMLTRKDLANIAGTTYETVIRTLNDLSKSKLVSVDGKKIRIDDEKGLTALTRSETTEL